MTSSGVSRISGILVLLRGNANGEGVSPSPLALMELYARYSVFGVAQQPANERDEPEDEQSWWVEMGVAAGFKPSNDRGRESQSHNSSVSDLAPKVPLRKASVPRIPKKPACVIRATKPGRFSRISPKETRAMMIATNTSRIPPIC